MKTMLINACLALALSAEPHAQPPAMRNYTVDWEGHFSNVGVLLITAVPGNPAGIPPGIFSLCSGTLIHEQAFLTAGHCTGPGSPMPPPFVKVFVSFAPDARNQSTWIPVRTQITHPTLPPCPPPAGCDPTTSAVFRAGDPSIADLGIAILDRPVRNIPPARFALSGALERNRAGNIPMAVVGYGIPSPPSAGQSADFSQWDGLRKIRYSKLKQVLNDSWASWELPGSVCWGDSGGATFLPSLLPRLGLAAVSSDGGIDCKSRDIRTRVETRSVKQWIRTTIWRELRSDIKDDEP